jgi:hypothetical protein
LLDGRLGGSLDQKLDGAVLIELPLTFKEKLEREEAISPLFPCLATGSVQG